MKHLLFILLCCSVGCSTIQTKQTLVVTTQPPDATVVINGIQAAHPVSLEVPCDKEVSIQCSKAGLTSQTRVIGTHKTPANGLLNLGLWFVIPGGDLRYTGDRRLDQTNINMDLYHPYIPPVQKKTQTTHAAESMRTP